MNCWCNFVFVSKLDVVGLLISNSWLTRKLTGSKILSASSQDNW